MSVVLTLLVSVSVVAWSAGVRLAGLTLFPDVSGHEVVGVHGQVFEMPPLLAE